jgi:hypothetical protein
MSIWQFQRAVTNRLMQWSVFSMISGVVMLALTPLLRAVGVQFIAWGAIDAGIALIGNRSAMERMRNDPHALEPDKLDLETRKLGRLLWLNAGLDVLYMLFGTALARGKSANLRGAGWGIIIQGGFLFVFDLFHALTLPPTRKAWRFWDFEHGGASQQPTPKPDLE